MKRILLVLPAMIMAGALATPSSAMPVAKSGAAKSSAVEQIGYRKCGWHNGHKHCRYIRQLPSVSIELGGRHLIAMAITTDTAMITAAMATGITTAA